MPNLLPTQIPVQIVLDRTVKAELEAYARETGVPSFAGLIRLLLTEALEARGAAIDVNEGINERGYNGRNAEKSNDKRG